MISSRPKADQPLAEKSKSMADKKVAEEKIKETNQPKSNKKDFVFAVGKRKEAVARVRLYTGNAPVVWGETTVGKGQMFVNSKPIEAVFSSIVEKAMYEEPVRVVNALNRFVFTIKLDGGGHAAQLDALVHGVARALSAHDKEKFRPILKKKGFLTRDARVRQRRKPGTGGKARRQKQSPKR